jgi:tetratricopeptide (TPR) repeat protein
VGLLALVFAWACLGADGDLAKAKHLFLSGDYDACAALAQREAPSSYRSDEWRDWENRALMARGRYPQALAAITHAMAEDRWSVRLMWQARQVFLSNGRTGDAGQMVQRIIRAVSSNPRDYRDAVSLTVFGEAALIAGADPKRVLDTVYAGAKRADPKERAVYLAMGGLALQEHDFALASRTFTEGLKVLPGDPDLELGLAKAYAPSDQGLMLASLDAALRTNPQHVGSLLLLVDHSIDAEDYSQAHKLLKRIHSVNAWDPDAWAYRAVLAALQNQPREEQTARENALKFWPSNPRVDCLIGRKLSQNYRFSEGSRHQRLALGFDPDYLPAKIQLAQDLLRLGQETEGWRLADAVQKEDGYDVEAYNLATLHDTMAAFRSLTNQDFVLRMSPHEAAVYGARALALLGRARITLCAKYGLDLRQPITVEVFPEQKDFAVRTFGMPGDPGYLGVCFGSVITANSPAAFPGNPVNWESMLWHEFCHVVTLHLTRNKMPRWLSEGISVYEEGQANPAWGQRMNPQYRELILGGKLTPVSKLSAAFLTARSDLDLQFAYYESSLVVDYLVRRFGLESLKTILRDLGGGTEINEAIARHTVPIKQLDSGFAAFARQQAEQLAPGLDFEKPKSDGAGPGDSGPLSPEVRQRAPIWVNPFSPRASNPVSWEDWAKEHPTNFWVMSRQAAQFVEAKKWRQAEPMLRRLIDLYPSQTGSDSAYMLLAEVERGMGDTNEERQVLGTFVQKDDQAPDAYLRLMQLDAAAQDWSGVITNAQRYLAVNPLVAPPYQFLGRAAERTGQTDLAISAYRALLQLDPPDPSETHFLLAKALYQKSDPEARRQVLEALEYAPRFRAALHLLLEIDGGPPPGGEARSEASIANRESQIANP